MPKENDDRSPEALIAQLRTEIEKRKGGAPETGIKRSQLEAYDQAGSAGEIIAGLDKARYWVGRAEAKNRVPPGWPRPFRGLRRNQEEVNRSLAGAVRGLLNFVEDLRRKVLRMNSRIEEGRRLSRDDRSRISEIEPTLLTLEEWLARQEQTIADLERRVRAQQDQLDRLIARQRPLDG